MRNTSHEFFAMALAIALLLCGFLKAGEEQPGAKAMFGNPATGEVSTGRAIIRVDDEPRPTGIRFWIELDGVGPVTTRRVFRTGDRIRIHIRSNADGYLSLWSLDTAGRGQVIFPPSGQDNKVKAYADYVMPGYIKFIPPAEDERLLVFFSRNKGDVPPPTGTAADADAVDRTLGPTGARALVYEAEENNPAEVGEYIVNKDGGPVAKEMRLRHLPRADR